MSLAKLEEVERKIDQMETRRIYKNVIIMSVAFMIHFTAACGTANLQSSINSEDGVGTVSLAVVFAGQIISNALLPAAIIKWLGTKWTMCFSFIMYMPFLGAQLKPVFYTMVPTAVLVGLGAGPLWCSNCKYLSVMSEARSKLSKESPNVLLVRFLGIFTMVFQLSQVWGNLISSLGIYLACIIVAAVTVAVGVDSMKRYTTESKSDDTRSRLAILIVTLKLLAEPNQLLLIIISIFVGFQQTFFGSDFTMAFVSCASGAGSVGFVMMVYGLSNACGSIFTAYLMKLTGRISLIIISTVIHTGLFATMLSLRLYAGQDYVLYIYAATWAICDSIWSIQIMAYNGILFPGREEAAFSNYLLWSSVGSIIAYSISPYLHTRSKIYFMMALLTVGLIGYFAVETRVWKSKKSNLIVTKDCH